MLQKIKIAILNKANKKQFVRIWRSNLKNYKLTKLIYKNRKVWARPEILKKLFSRKNIGYKRVPEKGYGKTLVTKKDIVKHEFKLWRRVLEDEQDLDRLMTLIKKRYNKVKNKDKRLPYQRIGISVGTDEKKKVVFINRDTGRENTKEQEEYLSTVIYIDRGE